VLAAEEPPAECVDGLAGQASSLGQLVRACLQEVRDGPQRTGGLALKVDAPSRRPEQHHCASTGADREGPALEPVRDRGVRRRNRRRQDERQDRSGRCGCEVAVDHAREQRGEADDRHRPAREPLVPRAERPERDEGDTDAREREVRDEASPRRACELDENE